LGVPLLILKSQRGERYIVLDCQEIKISSGDCHVCLQISSFEFFGNFQLSCLDSTSWIYFNVSEDLDAKRMPLLLKGASEKALLLAEPPVSILLVLAQSMTETAFRTGSAYPAILLDLDGKVYLQFGFIHITDRWSRVVIYSPTQMKLWLRAGADISGRPEGYLQ
jgi:hypothetical protein